jgi:DNA-binding response OmpR family regulator
MGADQKARLLVVDDEPRLRAGLRELFNLMGYQVEEAASGREALQLLEGASYDLMVLDIRMPGMDGIEVMRRTRQICPDLPIVVLTAHASLESAIAAVKSDAVDYLHKPIDIEDLAATISRALQERAEQLRRQRLLDVMGDALDVLREGSAPPPVSSPVPVSETEPVFETASADHLPTFPELAPAPAERFLRAGPLTLDRQKRLVVVAGDPALTVELTEREAAALIVLMEQPNQVLSYSRLARVLTDYDLDKLEAQNMVRLCIHRLRRKIEANPRKPDLIRTVRGRGYFFSSA